MQLTDQERKLIDLIREVDRFREYYMITIPEAIKRSDKAQQFLSNKFEPRDSDLPFKKEYDRQFKEADPFESDIPSIDMILQRPKYYNENK